MCCRGFLTTLRHSDPARTGNTASQVPSLPLHQSEYLSVFMRPCDAVLPVLAGSLWRSIRSPWRSVTRYTLSWLQTYILILLEQQLN